jgi:hypothetical protein
MNWIKTIRSRAESLISNVWEMTKIPKLANRTIQSALDRRLFLLAALIKTLPFSVAAVSSAWAVVAKFDSSASWAHVAHWLLLPVLPTLLLVDALFDAYSRFKRGE